MIFISTLSKVSMCVCVGMCSPSVTMETNKISPKLGKSLFSQQGREKELTLNKEVTNETVKMF